MSDLYIIMGPAGCGKSSVATALCDQTHWTMVEADDYHPPENVEKQRNRIPLTDQDRVIWLDQLISAINDAPGPSIVLACSALTPYVQGRLRDEIDRALHWILIDVPTEVLRERLIARTEHFMPVELLESQIASLSPPPGVRRIRGDQPISKICQDILHPR
ncbi:MAG: gluconokinase, GntK/IdnK-type [Pseudomonadota bacterium]